MNFVFVSLMNGFARVDADKIEKEIFDRFQRLDFDQFIQKIIDCRHLHYDLLSKFFLRNSIIVDKYFVLKKH